MRFIYCETIELKNLQGPDVLNLLIAVDELNIHSLITYIQEYLIDHQTEFLHQNPTGVLEIVYQHETFTDLWNFCLEKICKEPKILFDSNNFTNLKAPLLEILLKRDDLNMDEIEIWNSSLLKWCFARQNMMNDSTKWSKDDITKIERSLHRFIPLIRFYDIEPTEFFYKGYSHKDILPQDLIHDLLEYHIVPNKKLKAKIPPSKRPHLKFILDSNLIESNHVPLFASWIDKKESSYYDKKDILYEFNLLYRSSRDGIDTKSFHKNCDNKGATIWIAKIKNSTKSIGGYNPLGWSGNSWRNTKDSFLFSFADWKKISLATTKLSYIMKME
ncbi:BTB/POZ domain-containing protein [Rhizophagus clarus]|uniref:BTB/POZ domain-containing protein n=1 Tax=Rhizophagus clarus TaxID=94130 RepID=A0A8H3KXU0_9GLOM|nr:BTB/POZ domain-containing protein [Rhizophagus clarus]